MPDRATVVSFLHRMKTDAAVIDSEERLRCSVEALMDLYGWNQTEFARRLGKDQSWVSRHLSREPPPRGARFQFRDLDLIASVFGLSPAELLEQRHGKWDRRTRGERRDGSDRRKRTLIAPFHPTGIPLQNPDDEEVA